MSHYSPCTIFDICFFGIAAILNILLLYLDACNFWEDGPISDREWQELERYEKELNRQYEAKKIHREYERYLELERKHRDGEWLT